MNRAKIGSLVRRVFMLHIQSFGIFVPFLFLDLAGNIISTDFTQGKDCGEEAPYPVSEVLDNSVCSAHLDDRNGRVDVMSSRGNGSFAFRHSGSEKRFEDDSSSVFLNSLNAGDYIIIAEDVDDWKSLLDHSLVALCMNQEDSITIDTSRTFAPSCHNLSDGAAEALAQGGSSNTGNYTYTWSNGTTEISSIGSFASGFSSGENWVFASDGTCTSDTFFFFIKEGVRYTVDRLQSTITAPSCAGQSNGVLSIEVTPEVNTTFTFDFPDFNIHTTNSILINIPSGDIRVVITDSQGCSNEDVVELPPVEEVKAIVNTISPVCLGDPGRIFVSGASGGSEINYRFQVNSGQAISIMDSAVVNPGTYTIRVFDSEECSFESEPILIPQAPELIIDLGLDRTIQLGSSADIEAQVVSNTAITDVIWTPLDDLEIITNDNLEVRVSPINDRVYGLTITDENGCTASDEVLIRVQELNCRSIDSLALVALYNSTNGSNWTTTWNLSDPIDTWFGIDLNEDGCVTRIDLDQNQLNGEIPQELDNLANLEVLILSNNMITGGLSDWQLPELVSLILNDNMLSGSIPNFSGMPVLQFIELGVNVLSGPIPNFCCLPELLSLLCYANGLSGEIPTFDNSKKMRVLDCYDNNLTGLIPELQLPSLQRLDCFLNQLTGSIPILAGCPNLLRIAAENNNLSGCYEEAHMKFCAFDYIGFTNNPLLPWQGDFKRFCNGEDQLSASCDDVDTKTMNDAIQQDCECKGEEEDFVDSEFVQTNFISPNGDGVNDVLRFNEQATLDDSEIYIYNRWGDEIYHTRNYKNDWDAKGYPDGIYFYVLTYEGNLIKNAITVSR